jgi:hypothetical protein
VAGNRSHNSAVNTRARLSTEEAGLIHHRAQHPTDDHQLFQQFRGFLAVEVPAVNRDCYPMLRLRLLSIGIGELAQEMTWILPLASRLCDLRANRPGGPPQLIG